MYVHSNIHTHVPVEHSKNDKFIASTFELKIEGKIFASNSCKSSQHVESVCN